MSRFCPPFLAEGRPCPSASANVLNIDELSILGEAAAILRRVAGDASFDLQAGDIAGLSCSALDILLDHLLHHEMSLS